MIQTKYSNTILIFLKEKKKHVRFLANFIIYNFNLLQGNRYTFSQTT